jgi:hypothetical protein
MFVVSRACAARATALLAATLALRERDSPRAAEAADALPTQCHVI